MSTTITYVLKVLYGHEMFGPDYAVVELDQGVAQTILNRCETISELAYKDDKLREMIYSSHMVEWVEMGELSPLFDHGIDALTGDTFEESMEVNQSVAISRSLNVKTYRGVECEMMHITPNRVLWSAYVDGWGNGCILRSEIEAIANDGIESILY